MLKRRQSPPINMIIGQSSNGVTQGNITFSSGSLLTEWVISDGHYRYWDPSLKNNGGTFSHARVKTEYEFGSSLHMQNAPYRSGGTSYTGQVFASIQDPGSIAASAITGAPFAADAFNRMKPAQPKMDLLNSIYELKDLPGMLKQRFTPDLMGAGNYWLSLQFGWLPLLRDVRNFVNTQRTAQQTLAQLLRDNGKPVRRRVQLLDDSTSTITTGTSFGFHPIQAGNYSKNPRWTQTRTESDRVWASARFRYWLPPGPRDVEWTNSMLRRIYGLHLRPSVVYNAIPWSWLVDWFSNVGAVVSNLDAGVADRLAADYIYLMRERKVSYKRESFSEFYGGDSKTTFPFSSSAYSEALTQSRVLGNPFGISLSEESLSAMQWSILGALGLSRLPR